MRKTFIMISLIFPLLAMAQAAPQQAPPASETASAMPLRYEIWVTLDPAEKMLHGRETIRWTNTTRDTVPDVWFHLYWNAFKNEKSALMAEARQDDLPGTFHGDSDVKDGDWGWIDVQKIRLKDGSDLAPAMEFMVPDEPRHAEDQTVMRVKLPRPLAPGEAKTVPFSIAARSMAVVDERGRHVVEPGRFRLHIGGRQPDPRSAALAGTPVVTVEFEAKGKPVELAW